MCMKTICVSVNLFWCTFEFVLVVRNIFTLFWKAISRTTCITKDTQCFLFHRNCVNKRRYTYILSLWHTWHVKSIANMLSYLHIHAFIVAKKKYFPPSRNKVMTIEYKSIFRYFSLCNAVVSYMIELHWILHIFTGWKSLKLDLLYLDYKICLPIYFISLHRATYWGIK